MKPPPAVAARQPIRAADDGAEIVNSPQRSAVSRIRLSLWATGRALRAARADILLFSVLTAVTVILMSFIFPPRSLWPLAFVGLAPWAYAVCRIQRAWVVHWGSFAAGWVFFLVNLSWLNPVSSLGYVALALYLSLYWQLTAWAIRTGRRINISPAWTLPVVWVGCEFLRGWLMTGFPWLFVAHAFYAHLAFIQVSDLIGAYGVSFLAVMVSGLLTDLALRWTEPAARRSVQTWLACGATLALQIANILYGRMRLEEAQFQDGPRIAVLQDDFLLYSDDVHINAPQHYVLARYFQLAAQAAAEKADLIAFPETPWSSIQNRDFLDVEYQALDGISGDAYAFGKRCHDITAALARGEYGAINRQFSEWEMGMRKHASNHPQYAPFATFPRLPLQGGPSATLLIGATAVRTFPDDVYPKYKRYNSALMYDADGTQRAERYDKMHLVPFGEIVPFRKSRFLSIDLHPLYAFLNSLSPFSNGGKNEYSLWPGEAPTTFTLDSGGRTWRFGTPICYEDVMPYLVRRIVWDKDTRRTDFLVNMSNDGWFLHGAELPQHLAICVFRAVENRVGIARAVNTGISAFIDPNGRIYSRVELNGKSFAPGVIGYRIDRVKIDNRKPFYARTGDWFAVACVAASVALWAGAVFTRWILGARDHIAAWLRRGAA